MRKDDELQPTLHKIGSTVEVDVADRRVAGLVVKVRRRRGGSPVDVVYVIELIPKVHKFASWSAAKRFAKRRQVVRRAHAVFLPTPPEK